MSSAGRQCAQRLGAGGIAGRVARIAESVAIEHFAQPQRLQRFGQQAIHAGGEAAIQLIGHGACGEGDDGHAPPARLGAPYFAASPSGRP